MVRRLLVVFGATVLAIGFMASVASAGEITGNGREKVVHGRSACAYSGQEDLQWFQDEETDLIPVVNPVRGVPGHSQSWGQIPKSVRDFLTSIGSNPGIACNPNKSAGE